ncbi:MAG TPA: SpoIIE family protein phosphatase [Polyangiales bacterium]|nr:SpoIIE family protein phosphatase [Polyangiales bacterium]
MLAVIDGLGHGPEAAVASRAAAATLRADSAATPDVLLARCHAQLRSTRGAAMSVVALHDGRLDWCGIGNVEALLLGSAPAVRESIVLRGGIVGGQMPPLHTTSHPVRSGDLIVMVTDGIAACFADSLSLHGSTRSLAEQILARFQRGTDDALVLVARVVQG